jgi:predicted CXXCH cytochrome family protein
VKKLCKKGIVFPVIISILFFLSFGTGFAQTKNGGDIKLEAKTSKLGPVLYSHDTHITKNKYKCTDCHIKIFKMKKGADKMTQALFAKGKFCGACHDGQKAFSATSPKECIKCHKLLSGASSSAMPSPLPMPAPAKPLSITVTKPTTAATTASKAAGSSKATCLMCHGPFDKLIAATAGYKMQSGEQEIESSPHRYVPHDTKDIPECIYCHEPHPVPLTSTEGLPKPKATWCYGCHHKKVLQCGTCH